MKIGQFIEYRGYIGSIEYDLEDKLHYGKLMNIEDLVNYHGNNIIDLEKHYHEAVDDYIEFKKIYLQRIDDEKHLLRGVNMSEKEIILNILNRLKMQDKFKKYEDGVVEFFSGWESVIIEFDEYGSVKDIK